MHITFPEKDSSDSVTWATVQDMARRLEISEEAVVHLALVKMAAQRDRMYPLDDGPISPEQMKRIQDHADKFLPPAPRKWSQHLFSDVEGLENDVHTNL